MEIEEVGIGSIQQAPPPREDEPIAETPAEERQEPQSPPDPGTGTVVDLYA